MMKFYVPDPTRDPQGIGAITAVPHVPSLVAVLDSILMVIVCTSDIPMVLQEVTVKWFDLTLLMFQRRIGLILCCATWNMWLLACMLCPFEPFRSVKHWPGCQSGSSSSPRDWYLKFMMFSELYRTRISAIRFLHFWGSDPRTIYLPPSNSLNTVLAIILGLSSWGVFSWMNLW